MTLSVEVLNCRTRITGQQRIDGESEVLMGEVDQVIKRDGAMVSFDRRRIEKAIYAAAREVGNGEGRQWAETLSWAVVGILEERFGQNGHTPQVEEIQDVVEEVLIKSGSPQIAKSYILYRQRRAEARAAQPEAERRWFATSARGGQAPSSLALLPGDVFLFGPEPTGLPEAVLAGFAADRRLRLPMVPGNRSLNLSNAVAVVVYEAWRQNGFAGAQ